MDGSPRGQASPYDGNLIYWAQRLKQHPLMRREKAKLLALQKGQCPRCGLYFRDEDILEIDHILPTALGSNDAQPRIGLEPVVLIAPASG